MSFESNASIFGNQYGTTRYDKQTKTNVFVPLGKAIFIDEIRENLESGDVMFKLCFEYQGLWKNHLLPRSALTDKAKMKELAAKGMDITLKHFDLIVDTLRQQEEDMYLKGGDVTLTYDHLGWIKIPCYDNEGNLEAQELCYRSGTMVGSCCAVYEGSHMVTPMGSLKKWCNMVREDVVNTPAMTFVLIASLSAVVNGLLSPATTGENPIVHLCCGSSGGKTTALYLATSAYGAPFDGERRCQGETGEFKVQRSLYSSWGSTENATITQCAGNKGAVIVLNELGKFKGKDMTRIVYDLSEGTDKTRLNANMEAYTSEGYSTTILSAGEISLLGRCADKLEGLQNRVMEIDQKLTTDPDHSRRIKEACREHNGWAASLLAQHIIDQGGLDYVLSIYRGHCQKLLSRLPDTPAKDRFVEKFAALFVTTAELASEALNIDFDIEGLIQFLADHETVHGDSRNTARNSYEVLIEECRVNQNCFFCDGEPRPVGKIHGRIERSTYTMPDGRTVCEEFLVRREFVEKVLSDHGFPNTKTCVKEWKAIGVLDFEDDAHPTRARLIDKDDKKERVFVFRVFDDPVEKDNDNIPTWVAESENFPIEQLEVNLGGSKHAYPA